MHKWHQLGMFAGHLREQFKKVWHRGGLVCQNKKCIEIGMMLTECDKSADIKYCHCIDTQKLLEI